MEENIVTEKLRKMDKWRTVICIVSLVLTMASIVVLICYNFAGVLSIKTREGTKYQDGFTYQGWQTIYYGVGEMIIQGYHEFNFDIYTCLGLFVPLLTCIVCSIMYLKRIHMKGTNKIRAVLEFVMAGTLLLGGILLFNCDKFSIMCAASDGGYHNFLLEYLEPALSGDVYFRKEFYPTLVLLVCLLTCLVKVFNGLFLLYQRSFAKKNIHKELKENN
jgi:hypothetical protein